MQEETVTTVDLGPAGREMQAKLAGAHLVAELANGIDNRDLDRVMATCHPECVYTIAPDTVIAGADAIRGCFERTLAAYPEMYHWFTNVSVNVTSEATMRGECRVSALVCKRSGATFYEVGTEVYEFTKETGDWLFSRMALTVHRCDPWGEVTSTPSP